MNVPRQNCSSRSAEECNQNPSWELLKADIDYRLAPFARRAFRTLKWALKLWTSSSVGTKREEKTRGGSHAQDRYRRRFGSCNPLGRILGIEPCRGNDRSARRRGLGGPGRGSGRECLVRLALPSPPPISPLPPPAILLPSPSPLLGRWLVLISPDGVSWERPVRSPRAGSFLCGFALNPATVRRIG